MGKEGEELRRVWQTAVGELQLQVTPDIFEMYVQPLVFMGADDDLIKLGAPNTFVADWLTLRLSRAVLKTLRHIAGRPVSYDVAVLDPLRLAQVGAVSKNEAGGFTVVQGGKLREAGYVKLWHDLRNFYGPRIGLDGVGLWAELRAQVHEGGAHPLAGLAWPGYRGLADAYGMTRDQIPQRLDRLREVGLVEWKTGRDLMDIWAGSKGLPDRERPGLDPVLARRLLTNADASRLYTVHDPLELPTFCVRFGLALVRDDQGRVGFEGYPGRVSSRWSVWASRLMDVREIERIEVNDWKAWGLDGSF